MGLLKIIHQNSLNKILALGILSGAYGASTGELPFVSAGYAQAAEEKLGEDKAAAGPNQVTQTASLPHYLRGVDCPSDPVLKIFEKWRVYNSLSSKYTQKRSLNLLNDSITVEKEIYGKKVVFTFVNYVDKGDFVQEYTSDGITNFSKDEFQKVVDDQVKYLETAVLLAYEKFAEPNKKITATVEAALRKEKKLGDAQNLEDILDKEIEGYDGLKVRDVLFIPDIKIEDFVPTYYYFGMLPGALGVTYLNTGVVAIDTKARIDDYINGSPRVLQHELVHTNKKIEGMPLAFYFDAELLADLPILDENDYIEFSFHPYLKDVRKISKILFNFDSAQAFEDVRDFSLMFGTKIEDTAQYKKLRHKMDIVQNIADIIQRTTLNEFVPEFYAHPIYWITVNEFLKDDAAAFKIFFYKKFEPTCLGGPEKTRKFMEENKEVVRECSEKVLRDLKSSVNKNTEIIVFEAGDLKKQIMESLNVLEPNERNAVFSALGFQDASGSDFADFVAKMYMSGLISKDKISRLEKIIRK